MSDWFDNDITLSVKAIKNSPSIDESIKQILSQLQNWQKIKSKISMLLFSNSLIIAFALLIFTMITFASKYVVETFNMNPDIPVDSILITMNTLIVTYWFQGFIFLLLVFGAWYGTLIYYTGEYRSDLDKIVPFFPFYSANESSRFFVILTVIVMSGGYSLRTGLEFLQKSGLCSRYLNSHINEILFRLKHQKASNTDADSESIQFDKIDTGLLPDRLRLKLLALQRVTSSDDKSTVMATIAGDLVDLFGEALIGKIDLIATMVKYLVLITVAVSALMFLDLTYSLSSGI